MRFNVKRTQVKIIQLGGRFYIKHWGCLEPLIQDVGMSFTLDQIKTVFDPANCEALDLVEPDRHERLVEKAGTTDPNYRKE